MDSIADTWRYVAGVAVAAWLGLMQLMHVTTMRRVSRLEDDKANKDSTNSRFTQMFERLDKHMEDTQRVHVDIRGQLAETNTHLARIEGRLNVRRGDDS